MNEIQIDHEAAKSLAERQVKLLPCGWSSVNLSRAYLDLHRQLAAERARVARIRQALTAWAESPHYVFDTQGEETPEWLALNQAIYDNAHAQGDEG